VVGRTVLAALNAEPLLTEIAAAPGDTAGPRYSRRL